MTELRLQMDDIDDKIFELFNERADVAERIGQYKRANGVRVYDRTRERTKVADATSKVPDDLKTYAQVLMIRRGEVPRRREDITHVLMVQGLTVVVSWKHVKRISLIVRPSCEVSVSCPLHM